MRDYEVLYIVRADLDDDKVQDIIKRVNTLIEKADGSVERTNIWGKRKLAYEVKHQKEGSYILQDFQIGQDRIPELEAAMKRARAAERTYVVCIETDPNRTTEEGGWWWEVAVPEVSEREGVRKARAAYEDAKKRQRP